MYDSHFSIDNIPFGIASRQPDGPRGVVTRLHDKVIFLESIAKDGLVPDLDPEIIKTFSQPTLNPLIALSKDKHVSLRASLHKLLKGDFPPTISAPISETTLHLPLSIRSFTDFSCSTSHLLNAGQAIQKVRRLPPGHEYYPIGYTGRSSSIVVSGTDVVRPKGMYRDGEKVVYGNCSRLDYELEVAAVVGKGTKLGETVTSAKADEYIFGYVLLNDWSARDIQALEMFPLGPMNGKSFATSISPWVITTLALAPYTCASPPRSPTTAPYLEDNSKNNTYDVHLTSSITPKGSSKQSVTSQSEIKWLNWTFRDLVAQQTSNGCAIEVGDLLATGTISGDVEGSNGCMLEVNMGGEVELQLEDGVKRMWLEDGDAVTFTAVAGEGVGFGECTGKVLPAL